MRGRVRLALDLRRRALPHRGACAACPPAYAEFMAAAAPTDAGHRRRHRDAGRGETVRPRPRHDGRRALPGRAIPASARWSISAAPAPSLIVPLRKDDALLGCIHRLSPGGAAIHRQADRAAAELRRAGGDRDGERAAASPRRARRWSSRPRPPRCCRSSTPRPAISRRCSTRCWKRRMRLCERGVSGSLLYVRWRGLSRSGHCVACRMPSRDLTQEPVPSGPEPPLFSGWSRRASSISPMSRRCLPIDDRNRRSACSSSRACAARYSWRLRKDERPPRLHYRDLPPGGPAVHRQADRAVAELRRAGGDRDGECAAAGSKSASARPSCGSPSTTWAMASRCSTQTLRLAAWNRNFQELLDLPDAVLAERPSYADYLRLSGRAWRVRHRGRRGGARPPPRGHRPGAAPRTHAARWPGHRGSPQRGARRRLRADLQRHHRAQARRRRRSAPHATPPKPPCAT